MLSNPAVECVWPCQRCSVCWKDRKSDIAVSTCDLSRLANGMLLVYLDSPSSWSMLSRVTVYWSLYVLLDFLYYQVGQCQAGVGLYTHMSEGRANVDHKAGCRTHPTPYGNVLRSMSCIASSIYHYFTKIMPFRTIISAIRWAGSEFITCTWYVFFGQPGTTTARYHGWRQSTVSIWLTLDRFNDTNLVVWQSREEWWELRSPRKPGYPHCTKY